MQSPQPQHNDDELARTSKQVFNLKLRCFYLEERLAKVRDGNASSVGLEEELFEQRLLLEERASELEERNLLLVKARNAIESLQSDLQLCRSELIEARKHTVSEDLVQQQRAHSQEQAATIRDMQEKERLQLDDLSTVAAQCRALQQQLEDRDRKLQTASVRSEALDGEVQARAEEVDLLKDTLGAMQEELQSKGALERQVQEQADAIAALRSKGEATERQLAESTELVNKQRAREAALLSQTEEVAKIEADEIARLQTRLRASEQERDAQIRERAKVERELEDFSEQFSATKAALVESEEKLSSSREYTSSLELAHQRREDDLLLQLRELQSQTAEESALRDSAAAEQEAVAASRCASIENARDEAQRLLAEEQVAHDALKEQAVELKYRLEVSQAAQTQLTEDLQQRAEEHEKLTVEARSAAAQQLERERSQLTARLVAETAAREGAENLLREERAGSAQREADLRRQVREWEGHVSAKLSAVIGGGGGMGPASSANSPSLRLLRELSEAEEVPIPGAPPLPAQRVARQLRLLPMLKASSADAVNELEASCNIRLQEMSQQLEARSRSLAVAESKLSTLARRVAMLRDHSERADSTYRAALEKQQARLLEELRLSRVEFEKYRTTMESRTLDLGKENAGLVEKATLAQVRIAQLEAELRQVEKDCSRASAAQQRLILKEEANRTAIQSAEETSRSALSELEDCQRKLAAAENAGKDTQHELERVREEMHLLKGQMQGREEQLRSYTAHIEAQVRDAVSSAADVPTNFTKASSNLEDTILQSVEETQELIRSSARALNSEKRSLTQRRGVEGSGLALFELMDDEVGASAVSERLEILRELSMRQDRLAELQVSLAQLVERANSALQLCLFQRPVRHAASSVVDKADGGLNGREWAHMRREVHQLLDSNARLALQMQQLGRDLQHVYTRFKAVEAATKRHHMKPQQRQRQVYPHQHQYAGTTRRRENGVKFVPARRGRAYGETVSTGSPSNSERNRKIIEQLGKIGEELASTASQLSRSGGGDD